MKGLKNCPFCGGKVEYVSVPLDDTEGYIMCMKCGIETGNYYDDRFHGFKTKWYDKAAEDWNRRLTEDD